MSKHLHLFKRGNIFYWRRRLPALSTGNACLQLSLRTADQREASIMARKLTSESDRMLDDISHNCLSVADAKAWLSHIIGEELDRIRRLRLVCNMDPVGPVEDDRRADWAAAQAWKLMAQG